MTGCRILSLETNKVGRALLEQPRPRPTRVERADMAKFTRRANEDRFRAKVMVAASGCWEWTAKRNRDGYASFWNGEYRWPADGDRGSPIMVLAHRWAFEHFNGPIPVGHNVLHHCDNPPCVNPDHLFTGTQADNVRDCMAKGRRNYVRNWKLTPESRAEIRRRYTGVYGQQTSLAREYGVAQPTVRKIVGGRAAVLRRAAEACS